ncbi:enoyl-CoA hydratase/isomerase family protein [Kribbia dieselivorans]|uniref:enoyl-CoA hydratase/isomerase family protein n=1 Tax=Kribbia dieselivorans TaxID=331526 RepID=UPI000838EEFE|nr:enoyl-CoA hydratase-related protein [Kribbia dieselivorans]
MTQPQGSPTATQNGETANATTEPVLLSVADGIATITLNQPRRKNAMTEAAWYLLGDVVRQVRNDASVRAVIVTGAGDDFCAGADLGGEKREQHPLTRMRDFGDIALSLYEMPKPVISVVKGVAVGAGCNLAIGADFVVATPQARFSEIFVKRGLSADFGGAWLLSRVVGLQQAKRLVLRGEIIDGVEAERIGMVTYLKPADEIDAFVAELATELASAAPTAFALNKLMLHEGTTQTLHEVLESEARSQVINFGTDSPEAFAAFLEKREPNFTGTWKL